MNNINWCFDGRLFNTEFTPESTFSFKLSPVADKNISFKESILTACELMYAEATKANKPISIALSGGMDSQLAAYAFKTLNIPFTAHTLVFNDNLNYNDIHIAREFCKTYNIDHVEHNFDILKFMQNESFTLAEKYGTNSPQYCIHFELARLMKDSYAILCGGDGANLSVDPKTGRLFEDFSSTSTAVHRFFLSENIQGADAFYRHMPEIRLAQFNTEIFRCWERQALSLPQQMYKFKFVKYMIYENTFPNVFKPREKLTGFEYIHLYDREFIRPKMKHVPVWEGRIWKDEECDFYHGNSEEYKIFNKISK